MVEFSKYHGAGNDFIVLADLEDRLQLGAETVAGLCRRRTGIGADGLIRLTGSQGSNTFFMDYRNADGSVAELCGNGIRCAGAFLLERGLTHHEELLIGTRAGEKRVWLHLDDMRRLSDVAVDMGPPEIGFVRQPISPNGTAEGFGPFTATEVSMGNPHLVLFLDEVASDDLVATAGPALEKHERFPKHTNVEFVGRGEDGVFPVRVWERGVGETLACGSGACAVFAAAREAGKAESRATIRFPGGDVQVEVARDDHLVLSGPAVHVFDGELDL